MKTLAVVIPGENRCGIRDYSVFLNAELQHDWCLIEIKMPKGNAPLDWQQAAAAADSTDMVLVHYEYGLFHSVKPYRNLFARFMKRLRPPVVVILHDLLPELKPRSSEQSTYRPLDALRDLAYLPFFPGWSRRLYDLADHFIVHAPHFCDKIRSTGAQPEVSFSHHPIPRSSKKWRFNHPKKYTFITPGFIKAHKGYLDFLQVVNSRPHWNWLIAGGPQNDTDQLFVNHLQSRIDESGCADRVTISGYQSREALEEMMTEAALAVYPYQRVTGSGAAAWAIGMGMPVMATDHDSFQAFLNANGGIALLPHDTIRQWMPLVDNLLKDHDRQLQLAHNNIEFTRLNNYGEYARRITAIGMEILHKMKQKEPTGR